MKIILPDPESPTKHPGDTDSRHYYSNVFALMPVTQLSAIKLREIININEATYADPHAEMDYLSLVESKPRWMQGLLMRLDAIGVAHRSDDEHYRYCNVLPAERVFAGAVVNHDEELPVVGVMHPCSAGWVAFEADAFGDKKLDTIADLKAHIGQLSLEKAESHNDSLRMRGTFKLESGVLVS